MDVHVLLQLLACGSLAAAAGGATAAGRVIHVAPDGSDSNSGSAPTSALASCAAAARLVAESCSNLPHGGIEVRFAPGQYKLTRATACGSVSCRASADAPIVFRSAGDGEVVFDAAARLESAKMHPVTNATVRPLLNAATAANVRALAVDAASGWTGGAGQTLQWGELPLTPSVWPNTGHRRQLRTWTIRRWRIATTCAPATAYYYQQLAAAAVAVDIDADAIDADADANRRIQRTT